LRTGVSPRALLALSLAASIAAGTASPSYGAFRDLFNFGRATEEPVPDPVPYVVTFAAQGGDRKLDKALRAASNLVQREKTPASGLVGLIARARQDVARLVAVLYENARYSGEVFITIDGRPLDTVGPFDTIAARPVPIAVTVVVGDPYVFGAISASPLPEGVTLESLGLVAGEPAKSSVIVAAEGRIADGWRQQGYPLAAAGPRDTVADHRTDTLDVALSVDPGPRANFGSVEVIGTDMVDPTLVLRRAGIDAGTLYSSKITRRAETRLRELGVFESVTVLPGTEVLPDGTIPVTITVSERKRRVIGGSVTYSNTDGLGLEVFWRHRNLFGGAEQLQLTASVARLLSGAFDPDYRLAGTFRKPAIFDPMTDFTLRLEGYRQTTEAYRVTALEGEVGLTHVFSDTLGGSLGLELERSRTENASGVDDHLLATLTGKLEYDTRDNRLDPSDGIHAFLTVAPAYDFLKDKAFATFSTDIAAYRALDSADRFVIAGRVAASVLTVDNILDVAPNRRLYLGGAGTVRGYAYQNIAPRDGGGEIVGGRSSLLASAELRYRINDQFGVVAFVDAGNVSSTIIPGLDDFKFGVGAGLRYLTPVGPIRLDVAVPLQRSTGDPTVALYVGLGQAF
jgi:translocation and assembly module TamA